MFLNKEIENKIINKIDNTNCLYLIIIYQLCGSQYTLSTGPGKVHPGREPGVGLGRHCRVAPKGRMFLIGVLSFSDKFEFYIRNHSHKQSSLLDTISNYIFYFGAPGTYLYLSPPRIIDFLDFSIDTFLELQNITYS